MTEKCPVKIQLVGSAVGRSATAQQFAMTYIVDDVVAIDAGCLGLLWPLDRQRRVEHVFLSHSHMDHVASLPLLRKTTCSNHGTWEQIRRASSPSISVAPAPNSSEPFESACWMVYRPFASDWPGFSPS